MNTTNNFNILVNDYIGHICCHMCYVFVNLYIKNLFIFYSGRIGLIRKFRRKRVSRIFSKDSFLHKILLHKYRWIISYTSVKQQTNTDCGCSCVVQGARGFPGTPGPPGLKGHRVSKTYTWTLIRTSCSSIFPNLTPIHLINTWCNVTTLWSIWDEPGLRELTSPVAWVLFMYAADTSIQ